MNVEIRVRPGDHTALAVVLALLLTGGAFAPAVSAQEAADLSLVIEGGAQATSLDDEGEDERTSKFEEYRDVPDGAILDLLRVNWLRPDSPWSFELTGANVLREDEHYELGLAKTGRFRFDLGYDQIPHFFSRNATVLHAARDGNLTLSNLVRSDLEADPSLMPQLLAESGRPADLRLRRDTTTGAVAFDLARNWSLKLDARRQEREGSTRLSTGSYIRSQAVEPGTGPGFFDRERFEPRGFEMASPVDTVTSDYGLEASFRQGRGFATFGWHGSEFTNDIDTLFWDNPFEAPPSVASSSDRNRFARGALDLPPDNSYQRFYATGGLSLPASTRVTANLSLASMEQDNAFLPFTQNEALFFPGPDGTLGTPDDIPGTSLSLLPASNLDGEVETTRADLRLTSRPMSALTLRGTYRFYEYDNQSRQLFFPGYAAFGDSAYRVGIGQTLNGVPALFNELPAYERTVWSLGGAYRWEMATLDLAYDVTTWDYQTRQVEQTDEDAFTVKVALDPVDWFAARVTYLDADRDFDGEYEIGFETSRVRAFDVWERERERWGVEADFLLAERWTVGLAGSSWEDAYPGVIPEPDTPSASNPFPSFPYGLNEATSDSLSATLSYAVRRGSLALTLGREESEWASLSVTKTSLANDTVQFDPTNQWRRLQDDRIDWGSVAFEADLVPNEVRLLGDIQLSNYDGNQETTNVAVPNVNSAVAYPFPEISSDLISAELTVEWTLGPRTALLGRYWYEPYRLDDFAWDVMQPYMQGIILETAGSLEELRPENVSRYLFLDSRYSDYSASAASVLLRLTY